ncbi:MAG: MGMT family protein [Gemmatimonadales bacterium]
MAISRNGLRLRDATSPGHAPHSSYATIYATVRRIPRGKVMNYGAVAALAGLPGRARQVGYAMHALPVGTTVPWHRVVNAQGAISRRAHPGSELTQRVLLEREGVQFNSAGRIDLAIYAYRPRARPSRKGRRGTD